MTHREIAALAFRVLALWVFAQAVTGLSTTVLGFVAVLGVTSGRSASGGNFVIVALGGVPSLVLLAFGTVLWKKADAIALHLYPNSEEPRSRDIKSEATTDLLAVAFGAIGMYVLVFAIPDLASQVARPLAFDVPLQKAWANAKWQVDFWTSLLQVGLGLWLMIGMRGIARLVKRLQRGDSPDVNEGIEHTS